MGRIVVSGMQEQEVSLTLEDKFVRAVEEVAQIYLRHRPMFFVEHRWTPIEGDEVKTTLIIGKAVTTQFECDEQTETDTALVTSLLAKLDQSSVLLFLESPAGTYLAGEVPTRLA